MHHCRHDGERSIYQHRFTKCGTATWWATTYRLQSASFASKSDVGHRQQGKGAHDRPCQGS
eukprot:9459885-Pyramimonas_sp.AAC.1